jgi:DNA topoisomerase-1
MDNVSTQPAPSPPAPVPSPEHVESARVAGLRYVSDRSPGIRRRRAGKGFSYTGPEGKRLTDPAEIQRIRALVIPPAWTDVWICSDPNGHIQVTARDARGRKQYRYHPRYRAVRDETKFDRLLEFSRLLPIIRERVDADLSRPELPREKVLATVVRLLEITRMRVGNDEYARENKSYGLTTLLNDHVEVSGSTLRFEFRGKSGKEHALEVNDARLARIVLRCQALPGAELFQYVDQDGKRQSVDSGDINQYLRDITGADITAKDFRTWAGTVIAALELSELGVARTQREKKHNVLRALDVVAMRLGNTRTVCRKYYVHPALIAAYEHGIILHPPRLTPRRNASDSTGKLEDKVRDLLGDALPRRRHTRSRRHHDPKLVAA